MPLTLTVLSAEYSICRLPPGAPLPSGLAALPFWAVTRTPQELSLVLPAGYEPPQSQVEAGWSCLRVEGPLDFALTGILAGLSAALAAAGISIFALSTFDTDYLLVRTPRLTAACRALQADGYRIQSEE